MHRKRTEALITHNNELQRRAIQAWMPHKSATREKRNWGIWRSLSTTAILKKLYSTFFRLAAGNLYFLLMICLMFNYLNCFRIFSNGFCTLKTNKTTPHNVIIRFVRRYFLLRDKGFCWLMPSPLSRLTRVSKTVQKRGHEYVNEFN